MSAPKPLKLVTLKLAFGLRSRQWTCNHTLRSAKFVKRKSPEVEAIVHEGDQGWRLTYFDKGEAIGHVNGRCNDVIKHLSPKSWKLVKVREV